VTGAATGCYSLVVAGVGNVVAAAAVSVAVLDIVVWS